MPRYGNPLLPNAILLLNCQNTLDENDPHSDKNAATHRIGNKSAGKQQRRKPVNYFPIFANLASRPVLVVAGGALAARKISLLLKAGPQSQGRRKTPEGRTHRAGGGKQYPVASRQELVDDRRTTARKISLITAASERTKVPAKRLNAELQRCRQKTKAGQRASTTATHCRFTLPSVIDRKPFRLPFPAPAARPSSPDCCAKGWKPCCRRYWATWRKFPEDGAMPSRAN